MSLERIVDKIFKITVQQHRSVILTKIHKMTGEKII